MSCGGKEWEEWFLHHQRQVLWHQRQEAYDKAKTLTQNSSPRKSEYYSILEMAMAEGCLQFVDGLVCHDETACMIELKQQMMAFKRITGSQTSAFTDKKVTFSGKVDGMFRFFSYIPPPCRNHIFC